jgi:long-chain acyl-CoA synthetase
MKCYFCAILNQMCKNRMEQEHQFIDYIEQSIIKNWDKDALTDYKGITLQYKDVARKIAKFHIVLESAGIQPGDKIAVCGRNSAHWGVTFLATITYGAVIVPILHEFKADNIHNIVNHSEAKLLFVGDQAWENLNEDAMPLLEGIASLTDFTALVSRNEKLTYAFEHRNAIYGQRYPKNFRPEHICYRKDRPEELAIINYTSGTTGYSKGVMLPYRSIWSNVAYCFEMLPVKAGDHIVSMLPMGHVFGMVYDFLYGFSAGAHIYFLTRMPSPKIIAQSFAEIKPRVISCVPLIVEKIIKKDILPRVDSKIGKLLLKVPIVNDKIKSLARQAAMEIFGGNFDEIIIGGAPFNAEVEAFLKKIGFPYTIAYGMTECGPIICSSRWETLKLASCGKATTRMEVRIDSPDPKTHAGEIVCRGMNMMLGYYKNPEATAQIIDVNGWLHTGDLGTIDDEGYVTVRGRSKNLLLTSSGQNIYPEEIESKLNNMPYVAESLIVLQHDKLVALIYPDFDDAFAHGLQQADIIKVMEANRVELNQQLPNYSQISKVKIHFEEFEKTAKKSIKRFMYQEAKG